MTQDARIEAMRAKLAEAHDLVVEVMEEIAEINEQIPERARHRWGLSTIPRLYLNRARQGLATADRKLRSAIDPRVEEIAPPIPRRRGDQLRKARP